MIDESADREGSGTSGTMITAFFDRRDDAETAVARLTAAGIPRGRVQMTSGAREDAALGSSSSGEERGFFETLGDSFFPDEDRHVYAEGLSRGGVLVTVRDVPDDLYDTVLDVLDDEGAVDVEDRAESWRTEGWTGPSTGALPEGVRGTTRDATYTVPSDQTDSGPGHRDRHAGVGGGARSGGMRDHERGTGSAGQEQYADEGTISVVSEELRVGKRDVSHGRARVRSYVYETPVSKEVDLSEENVEIERQPVDRAVSPGDDAFRDRSIEAEEHRDEAVVSKEARLTDEIELRRTADTHRETVSETVRNTEVEDDRDARDDRGRKTR
jgi:stress response protein YsnF